jgi:hypothetical protein
MARSAAAVWVFDLDGCLIDALTGTRLRPGAATLLHDLRAVAAGVHLWSAGGAEYARRRAEAVGVGELFDGIHDKDQRSSDGSYVAAFVADLSAAVFVDDTPGDVPRAATVIPVRPYLAPHDHDRGLDVVAHHAGLASPDPARAD